jgi:hypothetical protein
LPRIIQQSEALLCLAEKKSGPSIYQVEGSVVKLT